MMTPSTPSVPTIPLLSVLICLLATGLVQAQVLPPDPGVTIDIKISDADSVVVREDGGSPGGGDEKPTVEPMPNQDLANQFVGQIDRLVGDLGIIAENPGGATPQEKIDQANAAIQNLESLRGIVNNAANNLGEAAPLFAIASVNDPNQSALSSAVDAFRSLIGEGGRFSLDDFRTVGSLPGDIPAISQTAQGFFTAIGKTDPFVAIQGSFTNDSETEVLDVFLNFEEGLFDALPLDTPLVRQALLDVQLEDTNGDGVAAARSAAFGFTAFGTNDPDNPTLQNTRPLGFEESLFDFIGDFNDDTIEDGLRLIEDTAPIDLSLIQFDPSIPVDALITHLIGGLNIEDLSPGDTVNFTAILSVGIAGDASVPLLPVENIESFFTASALVAEFGAVPEPNSLVLLSFASLGWLRRRAR